MEHHARVGEVSPELGGERAAGAPAAEQKWRVRIRDQIQVKIKFSASQPRLVLITADGGSQMGRLTTIISHAGFLKLEHVCVQYVTNTTSGSRSYLPQAPTQSHAKA